MRLIMRLCNQLHVLNYGLTIGEGTPEQIRQNPAVIEAYLGSTRGEQHAPA
jgi:ABC-type branched-subunit amino acid transport system ATPase component